MKGPKFRYRYKLLINLRVLKFQPHQIVLVNDHLADRVVCQRIPAPAHIADSLTARSHLRSQDRFQPLDIGLQLFGILIRLFLLFLELSLIHI